MKISIDHFKTKISINRVVRSFIFTDLTFLGGWGLIDPIMAIFVINHIPGASLITLGIMAAIYWITKSVIQIPIAIFLDKTDGEKDDFYALVIGLLVASLATFSFMAATTVAHLYIIQLIKAVAFSLYVPAWSAIVSRHLDKDQVAFEWALDSTAVGVSLGVAGLLGSWLAKYNFNFVFLAAGFFGLLSAMMLLWAPNLILPKETKPEELLQDHRPANIQK